MLIKNFDIGNQFIFDGSLLTIRNYAGTITYRTSKGISDIQVYCVEYKNELFYATDIALQTNNANIFKKAIAHMGYRGNIDYMKYQKEYALWKDVIYRCYWDNNSIYSYYGAQGVTIDSRWLCFELFLYDLVNMNNYDKFKSSDKKYDLDMSKQKNVSIDQRVYAPGKVNLKPLWQTDVSKAIEEKNSTGTAQAVGSYMDSTVVSQKTVDVKRKEYKPLPNGNYSYEAYTSIIQNPQNLLIPGNDDLGIGATRTFNGVLYNDRPPLKPYNNKLK